MISHCPNSLRTLLLALLSLSWLTGCGGKESSRSGDGKVHIKLAHFYTDQKDTWQHDVVDPFMKANPNIVVDVEAIPFGLYTTKLLAAAASGETLADVIVIDDWFGQDLFKHNYTFPLDSLFAHDFQSTDFFTSFFTVWRKGNIPTGTLEAMPAAAGVTALFYNKDLFDAAHLPYPDSTWTYDDFLRAARALTNPANKQWGVLLDDGLFTGIDTYIYSNGGQILSPDKTHSAMMQPATIAVIQQYVDLVQKEHVAQPPDPSQNLGQTFLLGKTGMMLMADVGKTELAHATFHWDLCAPPRGSAGLLDRQYGQAFGITRTSPHPAEAWSLIKYIVTLPQKTGINDVFNSAIPIYKPLAYSNDYLDGAPKCNRRSLLSIAESRSTFTLITPGWQEWRDRAFTPNMQDMLSGRVSVHDGCATIDRAIEQVLARSR